MVTKELLQGNELNRGHSMFVFQSQDEYRTKGSEFLPSIPSQIWPSFVIGPK